jgi:hypothetical protein
MPSIVKEKGNMRSCKSQYLQVKKIHRELTETITEMKSIDPTSTAAIDQLEIAQVAVAKARTLFAASSQEELASNKKGKCDKQPTMLERAELFQQWQAKRSGEANYLSPDEIPA